MAIKLLTDYSKEDFTNAFTKLLPPGKYWHSEDAESAINLLSSALGQELKTTHDETQQSLLIQLDKTNQGWRIADYKALLQQWNATATVYDKASEPNLIFIEFDKNQLIGEVTKRLEKHRLPHTAFNFKRISSGRVFVAIAYATTRINRTKMIAGY